MYDIRGVDGAFGRVSRLRAAAGDADRGVVDLTQSQVCKIDAPVILVVDVAAARVSFSVALLYRVQTFGSNVRSTMFRLGESHSLYRIWE